jgi:hypothetical protein
MLDTLLAAVYWMGNVSLDFSAAASDRIDRP